jgi:pilus assembly protein CpaE
MTDKIRVLIVDDIPETRENVRKLLQFESDLEVVGHAGGGEEAIRMAVELRPDIVLMDINMPDYDGINATQIINKKVSTSQVIIMSVQSEADYLRRAMLAGARDFLMKPFSGDELVEAVRQVYETRPVAVQPVQVVRSVAGSSDSQSQAPARFGKVLTVFSPNGGTGCTTVAVNVSVTLANMGHETLLIDGSMQFGDVGVMLNLKSLASVIDVVERVSELDDDLISSVLVTHESGLKVLLAPPRPEMAELVRDSTMVTLLDAFRDMFDYVIIDTSSILNDVNLALLDAADRIILIAHQNLPNLKNVSRFFDLSEDLNYDRQKVILVINNASKKFNISIKDIEDTLKWPATAVIPEDPTAYLAADQGRPLVSEDWRRKPGARALNRLSQKLVGELGRDGRAGDSKKEKAPAGLARLFNR